ncbi:MAG: NADH-quinone oxidoreductase subunit [Archaeoglobaceae archaeon]|nr:NADH-quinone oxidoreductase subunit [Archaeoglobaceae archaeon]MDK2876487.1 NADH-quinone oxidoreductase subunit [Archaeoglobaceae archaeon]
MEFLINSLLDIQNRYGYLPKEELKRISSKFNVPISRLYSIATFYSAFSLKPPAKHKINICKGTACVIKGSEVLEDAIRGYVDGVNLGYEPIRCFGACSMAPVVVIDGEIHGKMTISRLRKLVERGLEGGSTKT